MIDKKVVVYDIEVLKNCFTYTDYNIHTKEINQFVLHKDKYQLKELIEHLKSLKGQIGFNNIGFDYPIIHYVLKLIERKDFQDWTKEQIIIFIYDKAQELIESQKEEVGKQRVYVSIKEKEVLIPQLDLFKIWHFNNKAKMTSWTKNLAKYKPI